MTRPPGRLAPLAGRPPRPRRDGRYWRRRYLDGLRKRRWVGYPTVALPPPVPMTVFTTVLGDTDVLQPPRVVNEGIRYVCFADRPLDVPPYETVIISTAEHGPRLTSRQVKILADHPALGTPTITLWHDASYELVVDPGAVAATALGEHDLLAFRHPHRTFIEEEAVAILALGHEGAEPVKLLQQIATYRAAGFTPLQTQITSTGYCLRRMTDRVRLFNRLWWTEVSRWCWRDQMSVDYALWKSGVTAHYIAGHYRDNPYAIWRADRARRRAVVAVPADVSRIAGAPALHTNGHGTLAVITPTCDRPQAFALTESWMARQTRPPDVWIVADGGQRPVVCTRDQVQVHQPRPPGPENFCRNLLAGLDALNGANLIAIVEDDDWYAPTHLETLCTQLASPTVTLAGDPQQRYYHLPSRRWRVFQNRGASLCQTAFRATLVPALRAVIDRCLQTRSYGVDGAFWASQPRAAWALEPTHTVVGMKGLPGAAGLGVGHRPRGPWTEDEQLQQLRAWIGEDLSRYLEIAAPLGAPAPAGVE